MLRRTDSLFKVATEKGKKWPVGVAFKIKADNTSQ